jgi:Mg2+/Co2+ transporter CorC
MDILLISRDPAIGAKVSAAALLRDPGFPQLLTATFGDMAPETIIAAEKQFRQAMISYGQMLALGQLVAIQQISDQAASLFPEFTFCGVENQAGSLD